MKTYNAKPGEITRECYVVDAEGKLVARTSGELTTAQFAQLVQRARG